MAETAFNRYVLITPVRNEEKTIEITIQSVINQSILPAEWVIVSDESTDRTDEIILKYAASHPFIRCLRLSDRPSRNFASVIFAVDSGVAALQTKDYSFLGLLDADIRFAPDYFEQLFARFAADPELGLAGGIALDYVNGRHIHQRQHLRDVAGAVQFFRRACFESLGGLLPIPQGGWDAITCVRTRMNGYKTATFPELIVDHLKPRNISEGNLFRRNWQMGVRDYVLGGHPLFELVKCGARALDFPPLMGSIARFFGYSWALISRPRLLLPPEVINHVRREQLQRLNLINRA